MPPTPEEIAAAQAAAAASAGDDNSNDDDDGDDDIGELGTDAERLQAQLRASRKAERDTKRQAATAIKERDALRTAQMSDAERVQAERDEAIRERDAIRAQLRERDARGEVETAARAMNAISPNVVYRLLDLEYDDDGKPTNLRTELNALKRSNPELFGAAGSADGGSGRGQGLSSGRGGMSDQIRQAAGRG